MNAEVRRLFLALWPDPGVRQALVHLQQGLAPDLGRPVSAGNLHLTLVFLGATPAARRQCLEQAVSEIRGGGFDLQLDRLGHWRTPEVLWAGGAAPPSLTALVQALQGAVLGCGGKVDPRPFEVHLTLFRKVRRPPRPLPAIAPIPWHIESFALVESSTDPAGSRYRVRREWPLAGSTSP